MADDVWLFAAKSCTRLTDHIDNLDFLHRTWDVELKLGRSSKEELWQVIETSRSILKSWANFTNTHQEPTDEKGCRDVAALRQGHEQYRQLHREQESLLRDGTFVQAISSAAARMPTMVRLVTTDDDRRVRRICKNRFPWNDKVDAPSLWIGEWMLQPSTWRDAVAEEIGLPPTSLLYQLPLAIHRAGTSLIHLEIDLTPPSKFDLSLDKEQRSDLKSAMENLKVLYFRGGHERKDTETPLRCPQDTKSLMDYLVISLGSQKTESLWLDFSFLEKGQDDMNRSIVASALACLQWPRVRRFSLSGFSIHLHELKKVLDKLKPKTTLALKNIYLMSGTWAEALDAIRARGDRYSVLFSPDGAECEHMSTHEWEAMSADRGPLPRHDQSQANAYITGDSSENPLRPIDDTE